MFFKKYHHIIAYLKPNDNNLMYYTTEESIIWDNEDLGKTLQTKVSYDPGHKPDISIRFKSTQARAFSFVTSICNRDDIESVFAIY